eukprot:gene3328-2310_t
MSLPINLAKPNKYINTHSTSIILAGTHKHQRNPLSTQQHNPKAHSAGKTKTKILLLHKQKSARMRPLKQTHNQHPVKLTIPNFTSTSNITTRGDRRYQSTAQHHHLKITTSAIYKHIVKFSHNPSTRKVLNQNPRYNIRQPPTEG